MDKLNSLVTAEGFGEDTIMKLIAAFLLEMKVPTTKVHDGCIRFRPIGASTYGGYIYRSGVVMIFNEHFAPFSKGKLSMKEALKELCRKSKYAYMPVYKAIERYRTMFLMSCGRSYEEVYGYSDSSIENPTPEGHEVTSQIIADDEISCYVDSRVPFKNIIFDKIRGETTLWDIMKLVRGDGKSSKLLQKKTKSARKDPNGKLSMPVIYPNYHLVEMDNKYLTFPNHLVMLDFDLKKQGVDLERARRARAIVENMDETVVVSESFTKGNFWAIVATGEPKKNYRTLACAVMDEMEKRLHVLKISLDRTSASIKQGRILVYDKNALVKHPTMKFVEI